MLLPLPILWRRLLSALRRRRVKALRRRAVLRRSLPLLVLSLWILPLRIISLLILAGRLLAVLLLLCLAVLAGGALTTVGHGHDVGALLEGFVKVADAAYDILISLYGEWNKGLFVVSIDNGFRLGCFSPGGNVQCSRR